MDIEAALIAYIGDRYLDNLFVCRVYLLSCKDACVIFKDSVRGASRSTIYGSENVRASKADARNGIVVSVAWGLQWMRDGFTRNVVKPQPICEVEQPRGVDTVDDGPKIHALGELSVPGEIKRRIDVLGRKPRSVKSYAE